MADFLNVQAANAFVDSSGAPLVSGTLVVEATDGADNPIPFRAGSSKQALRKRIERTITNGSLDGTLQLANPNVTSPQNIGYRFTITSLETGEVTVIPRVLIADDGTGNWNIGSLNTGLSMPGIPVTVVSGPPGTPGTNGRDGNFGKLAPAASTADYSLANAANVLPSNGSLAPGVTYFDNGSQFCGDDIGRTFSTFHKRSFSSTELPYAHVFAPSGSRPTGDNSFTQAGFYLAPNIFNLFPDIGNGLSNPKHSFNRDGSAYHAGNLSISGAFYGSTGSFSGAVTARTFQAYPAGGISSNDFISCNSAGNLPSPSAGYAGGYAIWKDGGGNSKSFMDFNTSDYGPRIAQQPGWKLHFATVGSGSANATDCSDHGYMSDQEFVYGSLHIDRAGNITTPGSISAGIAAVGDAITALQFPPLFQMRVDSLARTNNPTGYKVPYSGYTYVAYGDSITFGLQASNPATTGYPPRVAAALGATLDNQGVSSDVVADTTVRVFSHENCSTASKRRFSVLIGTNDDHVPTGIIDWKAYHLAVLAWLGTVAEDRIDGQTASAANWTNDTRFAAVTGKTTSTSGATITYTVPTYGRPLYIWYLTYRYSNPDRFGGGAFTVQIDGGASIPVLSAPDGGAFGQTGGVAVKLLRIPVAAGNHSVKITSTAADLSTIISMGTPARHAYYDSPFVAVGGVIPEKDNVQPRSVTYTDWAMDNVLLLQSDGLDIRAVNARSAMQNGLASLYGDQYHPNDGGYAALALPFVEVLQRPPDTRYVARWTPRSSSSVGTPGDAWSDDGYFYGAKLTGALFRFAAGSW